MTRFVCLANSYKEKGRCIAGIELDDSNKPIFCNDIPKWIRPISSELHGVVSTSLVDGFNLLDIIEFNSVERIPTIHQTENVSFVSNSMRKVGVLTIESLGALCSHNPLIFGNKGKAVHQDDISNLNHSLLLISTKSFKIIEKNKDEQTNKTQKRLIFNHQEHEYDFSVTDPVFINLYESNKAILETKTEIFLTISLAVEFNSFYHKLVAGVIY